MWQNTASFFRNIFSLFVIIAICSTSIYGQVRQLPSPYAGTTTPSFVRTWDATALETDPAILVTRQLRDVKQTTQYLDGLGRPLQMVAKEGSLQTASGIKADVVSAVEYDAFGRETFKYLAFPSNDLTGSFTSDGNFKINPFQQQAAFMTAQYGAQSQTYFYGQTDFEASPLNRVNKTMAAGNSWKGSSRGINMYFLVNTAVDEVRIWNVQNSTGFATYTSNAIYGDGQLYKMVTVDEKNKQVIEFKDKDGQVVLKKVQLTGAGDQGSGSNHEGWLCTYYIYDDLNNLRCIIQPRGVELLRLSNWDLHANNSVLVNEQCFQYAYDHRNRLVMKKVPGAGEVYMVYDIRDRLVMTQGANLRLQQKWLLTVYDGLNRPVGTGLIPAVNNTYAGFLEHINLAAGDPDDYPNINPSNIEMLTLTGYDDYTTIPTTSGLTQTYDGSYDPGILLTGSQIFPYPQVMNQSLQTKGMVTWTQTKVLGIVNTYTYLVNIYDDKGRIIQVKTKNLAGGMDLLTTQYSWSGQPLMVLEKKSKPAPVPNDMLTVTHYVYDDLGRLTKTEKKTASSLINGGALPGYTTVSELTYDALGQLKTKNVGRKKDATGNYTTTPLETLSYDYNIRGWVLGTNRDYVKDANNTNYFGFDLGYDQNGVLGSYTPQYNGNISGTVWKSRGDGEKRKYDFSYDEVNRLKLADFTQYTGSTFAKGAIDFSEGGINYDQNGNILSLSRTGLKASSSPVIDNLVYTYRNSQGTSYSNQLLSVTDNGVAGADNGKLGDFKDGANGTANDYTYDANGNLVSDQNKAISSITYNYLNLPAVITMDKGTISYYYDAAGSKLAKVVAETGKPAKTTLYLGSSIYQNDTLQFVSHEEGRIRFKPAVGTAPASFVYDYFLKDHLGNTRMVLTEEYQQEIYPAVTLEGNITTPGSPNAIYVEKDYYSIDTNYVVDKSLVTGITDYPNNNGFTNNNPYSNTDALSTKLYALNGSVKKSGLGILIKVMAGDRIDIGGKSYYFSNNTGGSGANTSIAIEQLITAIVGTPGGLIKEGSLTGNTGFTGGAIPFLNNPLRDDPNPQKPKAGINWIALDEQFKFVNGNYSPVGTQNVVTTHVGTALTNIEIQKNGYIYVYVSNESPVYVLFDNLQVVHTRGPILEETHYYPFGLTMAGISSKAVGKLENKKGFNGNELQDNEFADGSGLEFYDFNARTYDQQLGRFIQIDPLLEEDQYEFSPYHFSFNNPIRFSDPDGKFPDGCCSFSDFVDGVNEVVRTAAVAVGGAVNAWTSNQLGGAGRVDVDQQSGLTPSEKTTAKVGQAVGDALSIVTGTMEVVGGGASVAVSGGGASPIAIPVVIHGASSAVLGVTNLIRNTVFVKKGPKDLVQDAKDQKAKEQAAKQRTEKRDQASSQGRERVGNSNQQVRGEHNSNPSKSKKATHENANARRAREQKAADEKKKKKG